MPLKQTPLRLKLCLACVTRYSCSSVIGDHLNASLYPTQSKLNDPSRVLTKSARLGFFTPEAFAITDHNELETINLNLDENEGLSAHSCSARLLRWLKRNVRKANENTVGEWAIVLRIKRHLLTYPMHYS